MDDDDVRRGLLSTPSPMDSTMTPKNVSGNSLKLWAAAVVVALSAFLFGYNTAALNGPLRQGKENTGAISFDLDPAKSEIATSITLVGAMIGAAVVSFPSEAFGRRFVLIVNNVPYLGGAIACALAPNYSVLVIGRFIVGIGVGVGSVLVPQLLAEMSPDDLRGSITILNQLLVTIGIFIAQFVYFFFQHVDNGWRYALGSAVIPSALQLLLMFLLPESPQWLVRKGRMEQAEKWLRSLRPHGYDVASELAELDRQQLLETELASASWEDLFKERKIVFIGFMSMFFQILTGINAVMYYSTTIFGFAGLPDGKDTLATLGVTALNTLVTLASVFLVERLGRKPLLLGGMSVMLSGLTLCAAILYFQSGSSSTSGEVAIIGVLLFVAGFAISLGSVVWPLLGEIFPNRVRSKGMSFCLAVNWIFNLSLSFSVLSIIDALGAGDQRKGAALLFFIFAFVTISGIFFFFFMVPETKGKTLQEIQAILHNQSLPATHEIITEAEHANKLVC